MAAAQGAFVQSAKDGRIKNKKLRILNMETNNNQTVLTEQQMLAEILEYSRKTHMYMKWQLYITVALVVLPLLAMVFIVPMVMSSLSSYGSLLQ